MGDEKLGVRVHLVAGLCLEVARRWSLVIRLREIANHHFTAGMSTPSLGPNIHVQECSLPIPGPLLLPVHPQVLPTKGFGKAPPTPAWEPQQRSRLPIVRRAAEWRETAQTGHHTRLVTYMPVSWF